MPHSRRSTLDIIGCFLVVVCGVAALRLPARAGAGLESTTRSPSMTGWPGSGSLKVGHELSRIPLSFIPNAGQLDKRVSFHVIGSDKTVYFTSDGLTFSLHSSSTHASGRERQRWTVKLDFVGARKDARPAGGQKSGALFSHFKGPSQQWRTGIEAYSTIVYKDLWPGIDLEYSGTLDRLKYQFVVHPAADPSQIRLAYRGASSVKLDELGRIEVVTPAAGFRDDTPLAWQDDAGRRDGVAVSYILDGAAYGFRVGEYDRSRDLVLDPAVLVYCGFLGGSGNDSARAIAVDSAGAAYVCGYTASIETTFPEVVGPDTSSNGDVDAFVAKVHPSGTSLEYCGFVGGSGSDKANGVAVDSSGSAYITGEAMSDQSTFPVVGGPDLTHNGNVDAFVAKVNVSGTALVYCGFIGGSGLDRGNAIAVDLSGAAYVVGETLSSLPSFPVIIGPDPSYNGLLDAFVAKVQPAGNALAYCGYVGSDTVDAGLAVAVDSSGSAYLTGYTDTGSPSPDLPVLVGPDTTANGMMDAFVAKVNTSGTSLVYCGYIGGLGDDIGRGIAVDWSGRAYVAGETGSNQSSFPVAGGPDLTANGSWDGFVASVSAAGTGLEYCGYIGGSSSDSLYAIQVDADCNAYVAGQTSSDESSFPVFLGPDLSYNLSTDAFAAKLSSNGTSFGFCGYVGGSGLDTAYGIAVSTDGDIYLAGVSGSLEGTFPEVVGPDLTSNGGEDAFVAKISICPSLVILTQPAGQTIASGQSALLTVEVGGTDTRTYQWYVGSSGDTSSPIPGATSYQYTTPALTSTTSYWVRVADSCLSVDSNTATVTVSCSAPSIVTQPSSQTIPSGQATTLGVNSTGNAPLSYQWYSGSSGDTANPVGGATSFLFTTPALTATTSYWVRVTNSCGTIDSNTATVTVACGSPAIGAQPQSPTVAHGQTVTLGVGAAGDAPLSYQWYSGTSPDTSSPISGATSYLYTTPPLTSSASYWVRVTNSCGSVDSNTATVTVNCTGPSITMQPNSQSVLSGGSTALAVVAAGSAALTYQWYQGASGDASNPISGATTATYATPALSATTSYWVRVGNPCGSADSNTATVTVVPTCSAPAIAAQPASQTISSGQSATLGVGQSGTGPFTHQWYQGTSGDTSNPIAGATSILYTTPALTTTTSYWVRVANGCGSADSATATISISCGSPSITTQPSSQSVDPGQSTTLGVVATGTAPLAYQWYEGTAGNISNPIAGAASYLYSTPALTSAATYWVRVSNACGSVNSATATVLIATGGCTAPSIMSNPVSQSIGSGQSATLGVATSGSGPQSFQWYEGASGDTSRPVSGATTMIFTTPALSSTTSYWVRVTNSCGSTSSEAAAITVSGTPGGGPVIRRIKSKSGKPGSSAQIIGSGFSTSKKKNVVLFGTFKAKVRSATSSLLKVTLPKQLRSGSAVNAVVVVNGKISNQVAFKVK